MMALVDSGADVPMFNTRIAAAIGLDLAAGRRSHVVGVGGRVDMIEITVQLDLLGQRFPVLVHFSDAIPVTMPLLGRRGVFERFRFGFDERARLLLIDAYP